MGRSRSPQNPAYLRCGASPTARNGTERGRRRWRCLACGRTFRETLGTPLYRLKTDVNEIIRAHQVVLNRGSLRAAEEQTGHNYETIALWMERVGHYAEAITDLLARDLNLSEVELDELWSFVGKEGGTSRRGSIAIPAQQAAQASGGDA